MRVSDCFVCHVFGQTRAKNLLHTKSDTIAACERNSTELKLDTCATALSAPDRQLETESIGYPSNHFFSFPNFAVGKMTKAGDFRINFGSSRHKTRSKIRKIVSLVILAGAHDSFSCACDIVANPISILSHYLSFFPIFHCKCVHSHTPYNRVRLASSLHRVISFNRKCTYLLSQSI